MANAIQVPKSHLIMGLSLPLAVLLGYFLAEPMELGSLAVVVFVLVVLSIPLMMRWYYPGLVLTWHAALWLAVLPGKPGVWAVLAFAGLLFAVVNRAVSPNAQFVIEPSIVKPLLVLAGVVVATGLITGGFGLRMLGSGTYGGKNYFYFLAAVVGYFVLTSRRIPPQRARLYVAMFFLSGLTYGVSELVSRVGPQLSFLFWFLIPSSRPPAEMFDPEPLAAQAFVRMYGLWPFGAGILGYLLARYGIRGVLDWTRPWRLLLALLALLAGLQSGFRSFAVLSGFTYAILFWLEGLHRTRLALVLLVVALLGGAIVLPQAEKLPFTVQRSLTFLPGKFDWVAKASAEATWEWRVGMWKELLPQVPKYLFRGKGWGFGARDFSRAVETGEAGNPLAGTILTQNFHNGPLSILIPFGVYGAIAFVWFLVAGVRVLHRNWKSGDPALKSVNALLLAAFAGQTIFFLLCFGALHSDMAVFTGLLGLSVALNGAGAPLAQVEAPAAGVELGTEYVKA